GLRDVQEQVLNSPYAPRREQRSAPRAYTFDVLNVRIESKHLGRTAVLKISLYEGFQVAVEDAIDISDFNFRPSVFDEAVRLKNVRTDLTSESNIHLAVFHRLG